VVPVQLTREDVKRRVVEAEAEIRVLGVARLALLGSVLRNEARPDSDVACSRRLHRPAAEADGRR
jgi:uncharacterized protein